MEPQDLKIKQEVIPLDQQPPPSVDPLQSLKEVKVPGYSNPAISQPLLPTTTNSSLSVGSLESHPINRTETNSPFISNMPIEDIKKEAESFNLTRVTTPLKSPSLNSAKLQADISRNISVSPKLQHTSPYQSTGQAFTSQASNTRTPTSSPVITTSAGPTVHSSQQPSPLSRTSPAHLSHPHAYMPPMHPHQHYLSHPILAAAAAHAAAVHHTPYPHHPYAGYPYPFHYGTYPIPQPIPPPRSLENQKREAEGATTLQMSHHSSSSSSVTTRSMRDEESNIHSQEITATHHHSSSHHASIHHHNEKQTISHSSSSSSSASVQHKVKRSSSPQVLKTLSLIQLVNHCDLLEN